jgi:microsomal dipeptidase-like Zn-dependent dipeptidase
MPAANKMFAANVANVDVYPPEKGFGPPASNMAGRHIWDVIAILEDEHGWSEEEIRGFLGENLLRVYEANWE